MRTPSRTLAAGLGVVLAASLASPTAASAHRRSAARADAVNAWSRIAVETLFDLNTPLSPRATPIPESQLYFGFASAAVYAAVRTAERGAGERRRHSGRVRQATVDAAVATAAHDVLVHYVASSFEPELAGELAGSLAAVPDGAAEDRGVAIGRAAAAALIASRAGDGVRDPSITLTPSDEVGGWRPTTPGTSMLVPWLGFVRPLVLDSPTQIPLDGPDAVGSEQYAEDFAEVKALGAKTGSTRTPDMTATALFWNFNSVQQFQEAMRDLSERHQMSARRAARMFAAVNMTTADALITCWRAKHDFAFWRPLTAIRNAASDGNDATTADPAWEPLATTPPYPDYPSGHACITGSVATGLAQLAGSDHIDLTVPSGGDRTVPSRHFDSARAMIREAFLARILLGLHFRTAMEDASFIGQQASLLGFAALGVGEGHRHGGHRGHSGHGGHGGHGGRR